MTFGQNAYYRVEQPLLVLKHRGSCTTNSYIGASMMLRLVKEAVLAKPGDEIHALVGGCFLVAKDGDVSEFSLRTRDGAFERSYGGMTRDQDILASLAKAGRMAEIEAPAQKLDYRQNPANEKFNHLHDEVIWTEHSPLYHQLKSAFPASVSVLSDHETAKIMIADFAENREVTITVRDGNELIWALSYGELDGTMKLHTGKRFNDQTGIVQTVTDSLEPHRKATVSGETIFFGPSPISALSNIDSHLAMAAEERLFPASAMAP